MIALSICTSSASVIVIESPILIAAPFSKNLNVVESLSVLLSPSLGKSATPTMCSFLVKIVYHLFFILSEMLVCNKNSIVLLNLVSLLVGSSLLFLNLNLESANT